MYPFNENVDSIIAEFESTDTERDDVTARKLMKKVLRISTSTCSLNKTGKLFIFVVKLLASSSDIIVKKLTLWFLVEQSRDETIILATCTLLKSCQDSNPMVRGLALRTLSSIPNKKILHFATESVLKGFKDSSAYVRRAAVMACCKIHRVAPELIIEYDVVDHLYSLVRDPDPVVVTNCLHSLEVILKDEGGIVINKSMAHYLLNHLSIFTDWGLTLVLTFLKKYQSKSEEETYDIMNIVDVYLKHANSAVVMTALQYFLYLVKDMPQLTSEVHKRVHKQVLKFIAGGNPELTFLMLEFVQSILPEHQELYGPDFKSFFCKYNDPLYVKQKKIILLPLLVMEYNASEILEELGMYCNDVTPALSWDAISAVGIIAKQDSQQFARCVGKLLSLLELQTDYVTSNVLQVLQRFDFRAQGCLQEVLQVLPQVTATAGDEDSRCAVLWLLGEYGEHLPDGPYMLEECIDRQEEEEEEKEGSIRARLHLLTAGVKLLLCRPAECQEMVGRLLEICIQSKDVDLRDRALTYYNMLKANPKQAKVVICGHDMDMQK